jgi:hypothetical protein
MTPGELQNKFGLPFGNFIQPTEFQDGTGFSVVQKHGDKYESLYKVSFGDKDKDKNRRSLWVSVSYGRRTDDGIVLGSGVNGIYDPIDLTFYNEYSFDFDNQKFYDRDNEIEAKKILIDVERVHMLPTRTVRGFPLRSRLWFWRKLIPGLVKVVDWILISALWLISGESDSRDTLGRYMSQRYTERRDVSIKKVEFEEVKTMEFFGYKAKRWSVVFYCLIHLIAYAILFVIEYRFSFMSQVIRNTFLALCYVVVTFAVTESLFPRLLKMMIKRTPELLAKISFKSIQIKT